MKRSLTRFIVMLILLGVTSSYGVINLTFQYNPNTDTTLASYSGSLTFPGPPDGLAIAVFHDLNDARFINNFSGSDAGYFGALTGTIPWGIGSAAISASSFGGDSFGVSTGGLIVPQGFSGGTINLNGWMIFDEDLTELGFDAEEIATGGTLTSSGNDINWSAAVIPESSTLSLLILVLCSALVLRLRRR